MSNHLEIVHSAVVEGRQKTIRLIYNPTIEDVVIFEAQFRADEIMNGVTDPTHRVARDLRDFLIRLGVER